MKNPARIRFLLSLAIVAGCFSLEAASTDGNVLMEYLMRSAMLVPNDLSLSLSQEFRYNDNIDETSRGSRSGSWINETSASLALTRDVDHFTYGLKLNGGYEHYFHRRKDDDTSDFSYSIAPVMLGELPFLGGKLMISMSSSHDRENIDDSRSQTTGVFRNNLKLAWDCQLTAHISVITAGTLESERYTESQFKDLDNEKYGVSVSPAYRYSDRTRGGATFGIARNSYRRHTSHDDYDDVKIGAFVEHLVSERTATWIEGGATRLYYKNNSVSDRNDHSNDWEPYFRVRAAYQALDDLSFGLALSRDIDDSSSVGARGPRVVYELAATTTWEATARLTLVHKLGFSRKDEKICRDDYDRYESDLQLRYRGGHGMTYYAGWNFSDACYKPRSSRNYVENEWRIGLKFDY